MLKPLPAFWVKSGENPVEANSKTFSEHKYGVFRLRIMLLHIFSANYWSLVTGHYFFQTSIESQRDSKSRSEGGDIL